MRGHKKFGGGVPPVHLVLIFLSKLTTGLFSPVMVLLLAEKGCDLAAAPVVIGAFGLTVVALEFPSGILADTFGRLRIFRISLLLRLVNLALLLTGYGVAAMLAAQVLYGASVAFSTGSVEALILEQAVAKKGKGSLPEISRALAATNIAGITVGALMGGVVPVITGQYIPVAVVAIVVVLAQGVLCCISVVETPSAERPESPVDCMKKSVSYVLGQPRLLLLFLLLLATGMLLFAVESYWQPALLQVGGSKAFLGPLNFGGFALALVGSLAAGQVLKKGKKSMGEMESSWWRSFLILRLALAGWLALSAIPSSPLPFCGCYLALYFLLGCGNVSEDTLLNAWTPNSLRSSVLSLTSLAVRLGGVVNAAISGLLYSQTGYRGIWVVSGLFMAGAVVFCATAYGKNWDALPVKETDGAGNAGER